MSFFTRNVFQSALLSWHQVLVCIAALCSAVAHAESLYQVELIVFARDGADVQAEEHWHNDYKLGYPDRLSALQTSADGAPAAFQLLPAASLQLKREATALGQRKNLRVLFHGAWQQPFDDAAHATSVAIQGGQVSSGHHELEGYVTFSAERYLHIDTHLWMSRFASANGVVPATAVTLPTVPFAAVDETAHGMNNAVASQIYVLQEQQRMRSGELHYQDHPKLGTLVLVTPVSATQANAAQQ